jgi:hypothetical protein
MNGGDELLGHLLPLLFSSDFIDSFVIIIMEYNEEDLETKRSNKRLVRWMMAEGFLYNAMNCERDLSPMRLERDYSIGKDHYCWRCPRSNCRARISVRGGSFFAASNLSLRKQLKIAINFISESSAGSTALRSRVTRKTVGEIYYKVRRAYSAALVTQPITFSHGFEYEVDELYLKHVKYGEGDYRNIWVGGIVERQTGKIKYYRLPTRGGASLVPPIVSAVPEGAFVYSDDWRGYNDLVNWNYHRFSVNHSAQEYSRVEHIGPFDIRVHINTIEGYNTWVRSKLRNRKKRTTKRVDIMLDEMMYRKSGNSLFAPIKV